MRRGRTLKYWITFYDGRERIVIERLYQLGKLHLMRSYIWLWVEETPGIIEMMKGMHSE